MAVRPAQGVGSHQTPNCSAYIFKADCPDSSSTVTAACQPISQASLFCVAIAISEQYTVVKHCTLAKTTNRTSSDWFLFWRERARESRARLD